MAFDLPDPTTEYGERARRRLADDMIAWLTTVDGAGAPQPSPVWFLWDAATSSALVYCQPTARRLDRIGDRPRAALNLDGSGDGHDVVVLTGNIAGSDAAPADRNDAFVRKYGEWMTTIFGSARAFAGSFSVPIVFVPRRIRGN